VAESGASKPKSKLAKMILDVLDDVALPTADEAEKQREQALAFALQLKEENDRKKREKEKKDKEKKKDPGNSSMFTSYMQNNWRAKNHMEQNQNSHQRQSQPTKKKVSLPMKRQSVSPGLIDRLSRNVVRDRSPPKEKSSKTLMMKKSPKKYDTV
jgi:hypothetical protein